MVKTVFRTYCGLAGDLQELLIAETEEGLREDKLIPSTGIFRHYFMRRAKRKLLKRLEIKTGRLHSEKF